MKMKMNAVVVTRHPALIELLKERGIIGEDAKSQFPFGFVASRHREGEYWVFAGSGRWDGQIVDCPANLPEKVWDALDAAIESAMENERKSIYL